MEGRNEWKLSKAKTETFYLGIKNRAVFWDRYSLWWTLLCTEDRGKVRDFVMTGKCVSNGSALTLPVGAGRLCLIGE